MSRREMFKLFAAGAVSLLGATGLLTLFRRPAGFVAGTLVAPETHALGFSEVRPLMPVMGETARWQVHRVPVQPNWSLEQQMNAVERYRENFLERQFFKAEAIVVQPDPGSDIFIPDDTA